MEAEHRFIDQHGGKMNFRGLTSLVIYKVNVIKTDVTIEYGKLVITHTVGDYMVDGVRGVQVDEGNVQHNTFFG
jgi:hypothetical protein